MQRATQQRSPYHSAYAGLDFIKAAFCPLDFSATPLGEHPEYRHLGKDEGLARLDIGASLRYARQFGFTDDQGHRKTGTQIVTAPFGLAPGDFDMFLGLYTYLKRLPELPADGVLHLTVDFIARQLSLPATSQKDYQRIRSRIFRFSYVKYTNSSVWNTERRAHELMNCGFFGLDSMSRLTTSRQPIALRWDGGFLKMVEHAACLAFDYPLYRSLSPALRRLYLVANRDGWNQRNSSQFLADDFAIHQIGYDEAPLLERLRLHKLKRLLHDAEEADLIRPFAPWQGYLQPLTSGPKRGQIALRWSRGPRLRTKPEQRSAVVSLEDDALYDQVRLLRDENKQPVSQDAFRLWQRTYGRDQMQKQIAVILAQREHYPGSFQRSEIAAYVNRLQQNHPEPDWYRDLKKAESLASLTKVTPNQLSLELYDTFFS